MSEIEGRTVVITGAASGIGRALALGFVADGARVVGGDRDAAGLDRLRESGVIVQTTDVSVDADVRGLVERATAETGRLDVLFNNAGYGSRTRIENLADDEFEKMMAVHTFGTLYGLRAAIPMMRAQGYGRVINTLSRGAEAVAPGGSAYGAAKAAMFALTRVAAEEVADADILVNGLIPGPTNTAIWGRDMPALQAPEVVYPTAHFLATLPADGPRGKVFWDLKEYALFAPKNQETLRALRRS